MPSTEQAVANLRTFLAADVLNPRTPGLTDSGRLLTKYTRQWLTDFVELLEHKNGRDQIQDFIWFLLQARVSVDVEDLARTAGKARAKADVSAGKLIKFSCYAACKIYLYVENILIQITQATNPSVQSQPSSSATPHSASSSQT